MCDIGEWRYELCVEEGIRRGIQKCIEQGEEKMIFAYLDHSIEPEMTAKNIIAMLCESFGFSHEDAQRHYEKYCTLSR